MILNCTPLFILPFASGSPASATFQRRILSVEALREANGRQRRAEKGLAGKSHVPREVSAVGEGDNARDHARAEWVSQRLQDPGRA